MYIPRSKLVKPQARFLYKLALRGSKRNVTQNKNNLECALAEANKIYMYIRRSKSEKPQARV